MITINNYEKIWNELKASLEFEVSQSKTDDFASLVQGIFKESTYSNVLEKMKRLERENSLSRE